MQYVCVCARALYGISALNRGAMVVQITKRQVYDRASFLSVSILFCFGTAWVYVSGHRGSLALV